MKNIDFLVIGDCAADDFIRLKDAEVHCDINNENCTISMRFGDKIPFESSTVVYGVGNAGNAAISACRLGLSTAFVSNIGKDVNGDKTLEYYASEGLNTEWVKQHEGIQTNYHYVLWYGNERTILIKHQPYPYTLPKDLPTPKTLYFSSLGPSTEAYHDEVMDYIDANPDMFVVFQPGTFQMKMGVKPLERLYKRTGLYVLNREEAARVLAPEAGHYEPEMLARKLHELGPRHVIVSDGVNGIYALEDGKDFFHTPMYPDPNPPLQRTGAGDALASTTAAYLTLGFSLRDSIAHGRINSAYVVQQIGAQRGLLTREKLESLYRADPH